MKQKLLAVCFSVSVGFWGLAGVALAATPILSVTQSGNSYSITVNNADANASVSLYEKQSATLWSVINNWGTTDSSGHFSQTMALAFDGSNNPLQLYVQVDGLSSTTVQVNNSGACTSNCGTGTLSLSQMLVSIGSNQTNVITAYPTSGTIYVSSNSNPGVASYTINGNQITVTGIATGGAIINVCANSGSQCNTITVSVNGGSASGISFSNASPVIVLGQSQAINVYSSSANSNGFYVSSNSNPTALNTSLTGAVLTLTGQTVGAATVSVCQTGTSFCANLAVTVGSTGGNGGITVSQSSVNLAPGQSGTVTVSNALGSLTISNNSNSSVISAGISGQTVNIYGIAAGSSTLNICQNGYSGCATVYVVVSGSNNSISGTLSFSTTNPVLTLGQSQIVTVYSPNGSVGFYLSSNSNSNAVSASLNGSTLTLFGQNTGASTINICATGYSYCGNVYATVNGYGGGVNFSQSTVNLNIGQSQTITVSGGTSGSYFLTSNTSPNVVSASLTGGSLYITALNNGSSTLTVCQSGNTSLCGQATVTVGGAASSGGNIITFSNNTPSLSVGQSLIVTIYATNGYSGGYVISGNTNSAAAAANISGSSLNLIGSNSGSSVLTVCQNGSAICGSLSVSVTATANTNPVSLIIVTDSHFIADPGPFSYQLQSSGGSGGYGYALTSGSLPAGLSLSRGGLISGTTTVNSIGTGSGAFTVRVTDSSGNSATKDFTFLFHYDPLPIATYTSGQLINEAGTIAIVYKNTKTPFASAAAFLGLGFNFNNVIKAANSGLAPSGKVVVTANGGHPRGSWLLAGSTVYFLTPDGLIPVPDWATFIGNGGQASFIVKANSYDLAMTKLSVMTVNDVRLH